LLPIVEAVRFGDVLVVPPAVCQSQLPVHEVVGCSDPIAHAHRFVVQVVIQIVRVVDVFDVQGDLAVQSRRCRVVLLHNWRLHNLWILDAIVGL